MRQSSTIRLSMCVLIFLCPCRSLLFRAFVFAICVSACRVYNSPELDCPGGNASILNNQTVYVCACVFCVRARACFFERLSLQFVFQHVASITQHNQTAQGAMRQSSAIRLSMWVLVVFCVRAGACFFARLSLQFVFQHVASRTHQNQTAQGQCVNPQQSDCLCLCLFFLCPCRMCPCRSLLFRAFVFAICVSACRVYNSPKSDCPGGNASILNNQTVYVCACFFCVRAGCVRAGACFFERLSLQFVFQHVASISHHNQIAQGAMPESSTIGLSMFVPVFLRPCRSLLFRAFVFAICVSACRVYNSPESDCPGGNASILNNQTVYVCVLIFFVSVPELAFSSVCLCNLCFSMSRL